MRETPGNERYNQVYSAFFDDNETSHDDYIRAWRYVEEGVERVQPDLIIATGDNIYGQTDDDGEQWLKFCEVLDSFEIPWAIVFGNHDCESAKGVRWQIEQVQNTKYGMIKQGDVTGNSNYTIGIKQGDQYKYIFYMLDSNGCRVYDNPGEGLNPDNIDIDLIQQEYGIFDDQVEWMKSSYEEITDACGRDIPTMICMHAPSNETRYAVETLYPDAYIDAYTFAYGKFSPDREGDLGIAYEDIGGFGDSEKFWNTAKEIGCVGMFLGHQHTVATSIVYDGIRLTYGMKTGTYDYFQKNLLGTTQITIKEADNSFNVEYIHSELDYVDVPHPR